MELLTQTAITALISSLVGAGVVAFVGRVKGGVQEQTDTARAMQEGMRCIMRKEIMEIHSASSSRGYITKAEHEHISQVYGVYHALGGNGTATKLIHDMDELPAK